MSLGNKSLFVEMSDLCWPSQTTGLVDRRQKACPQASSSRQLATVQAIPGRSTLTSDLGCTSRLGLVLFVPWEERTWGAGQPHPAGANTVTAGILHSSFDSSAFVGRCERRAETGAAWGNVCRNARCKAQAIATTWSWSLIPHHADGSREGVARNRGHFRPRHNIMPAGQPPACLSTAA